MAMILLIWSACIYIILAVVFKIQQPPWDGSASYNCIFIFTVEECWGCWGLRLLGAVSWTPWSTSPKLHWLFLKLQPKMIWIQGYFPENYPPWNLKIPLPNRRSIYNIHPFLWVPGAAAPALLRVHGADIEVLKSCGRRPTHGGFFNKYPIISWRPSPLKTNMASWIFLLVVDRSANRWFSMVMLVFPRCNSILLVS